jgi:hypothetical protein
MIEMASKLLKEHCMAFGAKSRKILIPDVPPAVRSINRRGLVIASLGVFCMSFVLAAVLFVFFGA